MSTGTVGLTTGVPLWPHQQAALGAVRAAVDAGRPSGLIVLPTGAGKTVTFATAARDLLNPALVLVHRDELVTQTVRTAGRVWPSARVGVIQGDRDEWRDGEDVVVASVQSLHARRLALMPRDRFGLLVVDEAHHAPAASYVAIMQHFATRFRLGVTATPQRLDGQGLAEWFGEEALYVYPIRDAIRDGVLVPVRSFKIKTGVDLDRVTTRGGDFAEGELAAAVNNAIRNRAVADAYLRHARGRRAICFAVDLEHVHALAGVFADLSVRTATVTGKDPIELPRRTLADFAAGSFDVLVNCQIATEGVDDPAVDAILMARPTQSQSLYVQCVGRGLRRCDPTGKEDCLVLDITDNCKRHKLVTAACLLGEEKEESAPAEEGDEEEAQKEKKRASHDDRPGGWRLDEVSPWPELPNLVQEQWTCCA